MPRDYNSPLNIKKRGLVKVGWGTAEPSLPLRKTLAETKAYTLTSELKQIDRESKNLPALAGRVSNYVLSQIDIFLL
jgi:hypothetical protein